MNFYKNKKILFILFIFMFAIILISSFSNSKNEIKKNQEIKISKEIYNYIDKIKKYNYVNQENDVNQENEINLSFENIEIPVVIKIKKNKSLKNLKYDFNYDLNLNKENQNIIKILNNNNNYNNNKILNNKFKKLDNSFFITNITISELEELKKLDYIDSIFYNPKLKIFLDVSTKLLYADIFWNLSDNNKIINGSTETACIIDTGIDFNHSAFGECSISYLNDIGINVSYNLESNHPYQNNVKIKYKINYTGFTNIAVHFSNISMESDWDYIKILDENNFTIASYTGYLTNVWTPSITGDTIYILLESDEAIYDFGFIIDEIKNGTTNNTINYSCEKILNGWDFVNDDAIPLDDNGHGTHVAGIISSIDQTYPGVAMGSNLVIVKAMDSNGDGMASDVAAAIKYCTENKEKFNISLISMSLGDGVYSNYCDSDFEWFSEIAQKAIDKNISIIVASGNNGNSSGIAFPSCLKNITSVSSVDKQKNISSFSQTAEILDLLAYGSAITSTKLNGGFISSSGTSMAAPHVSGAILLINHYLKVKNRTLNPYELEHVLKNNSIPIFDNRNNLTFPLVNLSKVLYSLIKEPELFFITNNNYIINNSNLSKNDFYIEFYFSDNVKNVSLIFNNESFNLNTINISLINDSINITNIPSLIYFFNFTNLSDNYNAKYYNITINASDLINSNPEKNFYYNFYFYVDTIKPKQVEEINYSLEEDGTLILYWKNVSFDINNNSEKAIKYLIYRKYINITNNISNNSNNNLSNNSLINLSEYNFLIEIEDYKENLNYTDMNMTEGNYSYVFLVKDASNNINDSIIYNKNQINVSSFCNTSFSDWILGDCINNQQSKTRTRICYNKTIYEEETISCKSSSSGSSRRSSSSSGSSSSGSYSNLQTYDNLYQSNKKIIYIKNQEINFSNFIINKIKFNFTDSQIRNKTKKLIIEQINDITKIQKNNKKTYAYLNITFENKLNNTLSEIIFSVNKSWLNNNNISPEKISLYKFDEKNWIEIDTNLLDDPNYIPLNNKTYFYKSILTNFSLFSISFSEKVYNNNNISNFDKDSSFNFNQKNFSIINNNTNKEIKENLSYKNNDKTKEKSKDVPLKILSSFSDFSNKSLKNIIFLYKNDINIDNIILMTSLILLFLILFIFITFFFFKNRNTNKK